MFWNQAKPVNPRRVGVTVLFRSMPGGIQIAFLFVLEDVRRLFSLCNVVLL